MRTGWHVVFWIGASILFVLILWLCWEILPPFIIALGIAYLLDPVACRLQRLGLSRLMATLVILAAFAIVLALLFILVFPILGHQFYGFIKELPTLLTKLQGLFAQTGNWLGSDYLAPFMQKLGFENTLAPNSIPNINGFVSEATRTAGSLLNSVVSRSVALISVVTLFIITPVVAFYMLLDWNKMISTVDGLIPLRHREVADELAREIDKALAGFLRGQSLVCLFLGCWYGLGLSIIGLNFGLLIGLSAGFLSFVPYVGSLTALVIASIVAIVQGWPHWQLFALTVGVVLAGQFLEANILSPKLVGDKVGVHPVWLIFVLLAFGSVLGFIGLVIAVPVAAAAAVILRYAVRRYRSSELYLGLRAQILGPVPQIPARKPFDKDDV